MQKNLGAISHAVSAQGGGLKNFGDGRASPCRMGAWLASGNTLLHTKFGRSKSNHASVITEIRQVSLASRPSTSLKIIGTDTDRSAT